MKWQDTIKRTIDVIGSMALIVITSPLWVIVSILIMLEDSGPIFYYRRVMAKTIERVMASGALWVKIVLSGRINGAEISRREKFGDRGKAASIPTQTLRANIDYVSLPSLTRSGYIGIKVWVYKGEYAPT